MISTHHCPQFRRFKKNSNFKLHTVDFGTSEQIKSLQLVCRAAEFKTSSLIPSLSPCLSSGNHSRRLFQKTIEGFDCKINGQALGAALQHRLGGSDGRAASANIWCFRVCCSRCWQRPARLKKTCYHSFDTDSVQEQIRF